MFGTLQRRFLATVLGCAAQTEGATQKGGTKNDNERPERYRPAGYSICLGGPAQWASRRPVISRIGELEYLAQADWHIAEVKRHITRQRLRVEHALDTGQRSELADSMLHAFEASLRAFETHRKLVLNQLKRRLSE